MVWIFKHARQFILYLSSGGVAAVLDFGSYYALLSIGVWYIIANIISGLLGFFFLFFLHKNVVFNKRSFFLRHLGRYFLVNMMNIAVLTILMYVLVEFGGMSAGLAKVVAFIPVVSWNFFVYKFFVYV